MEEARAWMGLAPLLSLLDSHPATRGFSFGLVTPEVRLALDEFGGNTRNTDVLAYGRAEGGKTVLAIEAKADERFDERTLADAVSHPKLSAGSNIPSRIDRLCERLFGEPLQTSVGLNPRFKNVRYQLVHGPIAAALEAERTGAALAVFAVHEFRTDKTDDRKHKRNAADLRTLWKACGVAPPPDGQLAEIELKDPAKVALLVGKAMSDVRTGSQARRKGRATSGGSEPQEIRVELTGGNLRNNHVYLREHLDFFPKDSVGGPAAKDGEGRRLTLWLSGLAEPVVTDIAGGNKLFFRRRFWAPFFQRHQLGPGDAIRIADEATTRTTCSRFVSDREATPQGRRIQNMPRSSSAQSDHPAPQSPRRRRAADHTSDSEAVTKHTLRAAMAA